MPRRAPAREGVPRRPSLISDRHRSRQTRAERGRVRALADHHVYLQLARIGIQDRRHDLGRVHVQTDETRAFAMAVPPMRLWVAARGATRTARNPHERIAGNRPRNRPISTDQAGRQTSIWSEMDARVKGPLEFVVVGCSWWWLVGPGGGCERNDDCHSEMRGSGPQDSVRS